MPAAIGTHWWLEKNSPGSLTVTVCELDAAPNARPPAVGRITVWITSLTWSTTGTLSATNSIASSTARIAMVQPFSSHDQPLGSVIRSVYRASRPIESSGMYAFRPAPVASPSPVSTSNTPTSMTPPRQRCSTTLTRVRLVIARCSVDYIGRLTAHLPLATRLLMVKADGSVSIHADDRAYKPLNWMSPPCRLEETSELWRVVNKTGEELRIAIEEILHDTTHELGVDPGLVKDGVEAHLQELLAAAPATLGDGFTLVRREYMTAIGPVDLLCKDAVGATVAVEIKRRGEIDGVEQLTRYLELLGRDPLLAPVSGIFAAQEIKPQARVLAEDRGIRCVVLDYHALRGIERDELTLF
jgi:RecB family endonuclease NucS